VTQEIRSSLDHCVKCTVCETFCPVSNVTSLFPGPKYVGPQAERYRTGGRSPDASLDYCSGCGICTQVCPQGVKIAEINARARAVLKEQNGIPLRDRLLARPAVGGRAGALAAPLARATVSNSVARLVLERTLGIHRAAPLPRPAGRTFQRWARRRRSVAGAARVVYFHGCSTNFFEPELGIQTVEVLEHNGVGVIVPRQGCCGLPLQSNGAFDDARAYVRRLVKRLLPYARAGLDIVATSTSCGLMLKREAREILGIEDEGLALVSSRVYDICEYLARLHEEGHLRTDLEPLDTVVPYHAPCQQRGHGIGKPAVDLLALVPGLDVRDLDVECCGIAGTYGFKKEKYDIAMAVGARLFRQVRDSGAGVTACDSETCRWQITHGSGVASVHPVSLLHRAYGLRAARASNRASRQS
jgi:glycerol-3-phosphate dehydrogenase subunit C